MVLTRNAEATQARLMQSALELYAERGYAGTCLDAILERARSSKGAFYHHFTSKEELTARALEGYWQAQLDDVRSCALERDAGACARSMVERLVPPDGEVTCPVGMLGFEARNLPELVRDALAGGLCAWVREASAALEGVGVPESRARELAERLFGLFEGGVLMERISGSREPLGASLRDWQHEVRCAAAEHRA